jgi:proteasome accessory factor A
MFSAAEVHKAVSNPPQDTRAFFRGKCIEFYSEYVAAASWESVIFDVDSEQDLMRINTPDVRKGTSALTSHLFANKSLTDFVQELQTQSQSAIK